MHKRVAIVMNAWYEKEKKTKFTSYEQKKQVYNRLTSYEIFFFFLKQLAMKILLTRFARSNCSSSYNHETCVKQ